MLTLVTISIFIKELDGDKLEDFYVSEIFRSYQAE